MFAKHIKIQDAVNFLKNMRTGIAVGTPARLKDLMEDGKISVQQIANLLTINLGALQLDRLERIVIDASHIDQKKRGILEMKELQVPLTLWLGQSLLRDRYAVEKDAIELLFY